MSALDASGHPPGLPEGAEIVSVTPAPTDDERAAITAGLAVLWPQLWPGASPPPAVPAPSPRWRYAGRPWRQRHSYGGWI